jgi:hypothetical protein
MLCFGTAEIYIILSFAAVYFVILLWILVNEGEEDECLISLVCQSALVPSACCVMVFNFFLG